MCVCVNVCVWLHLSLSLFPLISLSVEHDFRQQEGRFQGVMEALDGDYDVPCPLPRPAPSRERAKSRVKKIRKKCFWWL